MTFMLRFLVFLGIIPPNISLMFIPMPIMSTPGAPKTEIGDVLSLISISTSLSSSFPSRNILRNFLRVRALRSSSAAASSGFSSSLFESSSLPENAFMNSGIENLRSGFGSIASSSRCSAFSSAGFCTPSIILLRTIDTANSVRSRMIVSTSRPT